MPLFNVFDVSGSALTAQSVRLSTISSNLANANVVAGSEKEAYHARYPVFSATLNDAMNTDAATGVRVSRIIESPAEARREYEPSNPIADEDGFVYYSNVNTVEEMANMVSASRTYQSNIQAMNTAKQLIIQTLSLGR